VKKYRTEKGTEVVAELFQYQQESEVFLTSYFTVLEVTSVATRLLRAGTLTRQAYQVLMGNLSRDVRGVIRLLSVTDSVLSEAIGLTQTHALRAPDSLHVATALGMKISGNDDILYFCGSDVRLNSACERSGLLVLDPEAPGSLDTLRSVRGRA
jgi:predicted nucleic acid-binding protein